MRQTRKPGTRRDPVGAQHAATAEEPSGSLPQEAPDAPLTSFSDVNSPLICAVTPDA
jgi:hypothetical protein